MNCKMKIHIEVHTKKEGIEEALAPFGITPKTFWGVTQFDTIIDIRDEAIEKIIAICDEYGDKQMKAKMM